jgi:hypothetical protein
MDYQQHVATQKSKTKAYWQIEFGVLTVVLILILILIIGTRFIDQVSNVGTPPSNVGTAPATIQEATQFVRDNLRDVNYDRKINCIDYAVIFYEIWPDAKIIRVWDNATDYNHLLNQVGDKYIEPQVRNGDPILMWRYQFPNAHKRDETQRWAIWASRRRW